MSWSVVLFIGLVFCMMVGPILMFKPSRRQHRITRLRALAQHNGLRIRIGKLRDESVAVYARAWQRRPEDGIDAASPFAQWALWRKDYSHDLHWSQYWEWRSKRAALPELKAMLQPHLAHLPPSVLALEADAGGVGCYWLESEGEATLNQLTETLKELETAMRPYVVRPDSKD